MAGEYRAEPEAMRSAVGNVGGIIADGINAVPDLEAWSCRRRRSRRSAARSPRRTPRCTQPGHRRPHAPEAAPAGQRPGQGQRRRLSGGRPGRRGRLRRQPATGAATTSSIWGSPHASELATLAINDSAGAHGEPSSVGNVLRYLGDARLGRLGDHPITDTRFHGVADFNDWLAGDADNQARVGLIGVYSGTARTFSDVPGGVHSGRRRGGRPLLFSDRRPSSASPATAASSTTTACSPRIGGLAMVRVYRPASVVA